MKFPNPEEGKGALSLSMDAADECGANHILANDPDADRLAVAERNGYANQIKWLRALDCLYCRLRDSALSKRNHATYRMKLSTLHCLNKIS